VSYDGNGADAGILPAATTQHASGDTVTVLGNVNGLAWSGRRWQGWSTDPAATSATYTGSGSESFVMGPAGVTLYAVWADIAPAEVTNYIATADATSVTLSWAPPTDSDFAAVDITYTGASSGSATVLKGNNKKLFMGLATGSTYIFTAKTRDAAGLVSEGKLTSVFTADPSAYAVGTSYSIPVTGGTLYFDVVAGGSITITSGSAGVTNLVIPSSIGGHPVTTIAPNAFYDNTSLTSVVLADSLTWIGNSAFLGCTGLTNVTLIPIFAGLSGSVFEGCSSLASIVIPPGTTGIQDGEFWQTGLTSIAFPQGITYIGSRSFAETQLTTVDIPSTTTLMGFDAFSGCSRLKTANIFAVDPPPITPGGSGPFTNTGLTDIYVPAASVDAYKAAAGWSDYASIIQAGTW
jgi:hypothetical protein